MLELADLAGCLKLSLRVGAPRQSSEPSSFPALQTLISSQASHRTVSAGFTTARGHSLSRRSVPLPHSE